MQNVIPCEAQTYECHDKFHSAQIVFDRANQAVAWGDAINDEPTREGAQQESENLSSEGSFSASSTLEQCRRSSCTTMSTTPESLNGKVSKIPQGPIIDQQKHSHPKDKQGTPSQEFHASHSDRGRHFTHGHEVERVSNKTHSSLASLDPPIASSSSSQPSRNATATPPTSPSDSRSVRSSQSWRPPSSTEYFRVHNQYTYTGSIDPTRYRRTNPKYQRIPSYNTTLTNGLLRQRQGPGSCPGSRLSLHPTNASHNSSGLTSGSNAMQDSSSDLPGRYSSQVAQHHPSKLIERIREAQRAPKAFRNIKVIGVCTTPSGVSVLPAPGQPWVPRTALQQSRQREPAQYIFGPAQPSPFGTPVWKGKEPVRHWLGGAENSVEHWSQQNIRTSVMSGQSFALPPPSVELPLPTKGRDVERPKQGADVSAFGNNGIVTENARSPKNDSRLLTFSADHNLAACGVPGDDSSRVVSLSDACPQLCCTRQWRNDLSRYHFDPVEEAKVTQLLLNRGISPAKVSPKDRALLYRLAFSTFTGTFASFPDHHRSLPFWWFGSSASPEVTGMTCDEFIEWIKQSLRTQSTSSTDESPSIDDGHVEDLSWPLGTLQRSVSTVAPGHREALGRKEHQAPLRRRQSAAASIRTTSRKTEITLPKSARISGKPSTHVNATEISKTETISSTPSLKVFPKSPAPMRPKAARNADSGNSDDNPSTRRASAPCTSKTRDKKGLWAKLCRTFSLRRQKSSSCNDGHEL